MFIVIEEGFWVGDGVGVGLAVDLKKPKKPSLFFWTGVGVKIDFESEIEDGLLFKFSLPVITAKKTKTTTKPKTKEITLLKLSI